MASTPGREKLTLADGARTQSTHSHHMDVQDALLLIYHLGGPYHYPALANS